MSKVHPSSIVYSPIVLSCILSCSLALILKPTFKLKFLPYFGTEPAGLEPKTCQNVHNFLTVQNPTGSTAKNHPSARAAADTRPVHPFKAPPVRCIPFSTHNIKSCPSGVGRGRLRAVGGLTGTAGGGGTLVTGTCATPSRPFPLLPRSNFELELAFPPSPSIMHGLLLSPSSLGKKIPWRVHYFNEQRVPWWVSLLQFFRSLHDDFATSNTSKLRYVSQKHMQQRNDWILANKPIFNVNLDCPSRANEPRSW